MVTGRARKRELGSCNLCRCAGMLLVGGRVRGIKSRTGPPASDNRVRARQVSVNLRGRSSHSRRLLEGVSLGKEDSCLAAVAHLVGSNYCSC